MFTPKRISPDCLFKSNHRQVKNLILFLLCAIYLHGMLHTMEIINAVCCTPRRSSLGYVVHRGDDLCGMLYTVEIISAVRTPQRSSPRYDAHHRDHFVIEYLCEIESEFENTLHVGCLSGAQMGLKKMKKGIENLVTHSI